MGIPLPSLLPDLDLKGMMAQDGKGMCESPSGSLWREALEHQSVRRRRRQKKQKKLRVKKNSGVMGWNKMPRNLMKRRILLEGTGRPISGIRKSVKDLHNLVPNGKSIELDGLFKVTADYIVRLEMQVKLMQTMLKELSDSSE
ncbi:uncharacterized protein LOC143853160 [Tasmannia lanceolata]|uniref:uncharacterized protein LOC143853160 n=1 Tax=Tasmannia lanceolata TaxID=3420 RepID=UPI004063930C